MVRIKTDFVPETSAHLITPGKVYEVRNPQNGPCGGFITADNDREICVHFPADAHLNDEPWTVLKESEA